ncbi:MAG TPA: type II CRISPR RNA-guided endonuclease Cas9, partial [Terriglobales bacterium]|nr:type II CRISPR RNA-guided endonuclease Cas9 [Terriglobales bacterium]
MTQLRTNSYTLGLDLGVSSLGWALLDASGRRFVSAGVRIFDSGMDENKFAKGEQGCSNNVDRRRARLHRRQLRRRAARQRELFITLQDAGLLSAEPRGGIPETRHALLQDLDRRLAESWGERIQADNPFIVAPQQVLPYFLRARALDHPLQADELGRALYHLGQRRGYKSNRREGRKLEDEQTREAKRKKQATAEQDEKRKVLAEISGLEVELAASGARTLGEFLSRQDPAAARIRTRHTARKMFEQEFEAIWLAQQPYHPECLTAELKQRVYKLLFHQRPISGGKRGMCELEKDCQRADMYTLAAQRFRLLQKVNDLLIVHADGARRELSPEQRRLLAQRLQEAGDMTFEQVRTLFGLPKKTKFNLAANGDRKLHGNRTNAAMLRAFGQRWGTFSEAERKHKVRRWAEGEHAEELQTIAIEEWDLDSAAAHQLANTEPEDGYCKLSLHAISKLLPAMEQGEAFKTAEAKIYGNRFAGREAQDSLPPVEDVLPQIPNPAVMRALTELRKVVNAIVREHGKPAQVRVELARDLKRSAKDRQRLTDIMEENRKRRAKVIARIQREAGINNPSGPSIEKGLLFEDLQECAYCGRTINFQNLFSDTPQFDVDHVLPHSRFPDNSYANKVLACNTCNDRKRNRTPYEAFGSDPEVWEKLVARVARRRGTGKQERFLLGGDKRKRLLLQTSEEVEEFSARHLADTRYISKLAARYLEELYGGRDQEVPWEDQRRRCVFASSGMVTATLRKAWGLNSLVPEAPGASKEGGPEKERCDHRHHAIDAMVVALSSQGAIQQLSAAAAAGDGRILGRISSRALQAPWPNFVDSIRPVFESLNPSHRPDHRLSGPLHDETNYSPPRAFHGKEYVHLRRPIHSLSAKDINSDHLIVDRKVKEFVQAKLADLGGDPKKLEHDPAVLITRTGKRVPIRKVRVREAKSVTRIAASPHARYVATNDNHHVAILAGLDAGGSEKRWDGEL